VLDHDPDIDSNCDAPGFAAAATRAVMAGEAATRLSLHMSEPTDGVAEVSASYRHSSRVAPLAFRLQCVDGRLRLTDQVACRIPAAPPNFRQPEPVTSKWGAPASPALGTSLL